MIARIPIRIPEIKPENISTGKYTNILILSISRAAINSCPILWKNPPATLIPIGENFLVLNKIAMIKKLSIPPVKLKSPPIGPENRRLDTMILTTLIKKASFNPSLYIATTIIRLASPSFTPGIV